jgi:polyferredoxin
MTPTPELDAIRRQAILSSLAGFPFLLMFAFAWIAGAVLSYVVPPAMAPWSYLLLGIPAMPIAIGLERRLGYVPAANPDPLLPLTLQILFVQIVAFPAILLVWDAAPPFVLALFVGKAVLHYTGFFVGIALLVGAFAARSHARATWLESQRQP